MINWLGATLIIAAILIPLADAAHAKGWGRSGAGHYVHTSHSAASTASHSYHYR